MRYVRCFDKLDMTDTLKSVQIRTICVICGFPDKFIIFLRMYLIIFRIANL